MKKRLFLMMLLLVSCNGNSVSNINSNVSTIDNPSTINNEISNVNNSISVGTSEVINSTSQSNDDEVIDDKTRFEASKSVWGFEMGVELQKAIGADLPKLSSFPDNKFNVQYGSMDGNKYCPYVNVFYKGINVDYTKDYQNLLSKYGFVYKIADVYDGVTWIDYTKRNFNDDLIEVHFAYYESEGFYYFDIYTYLLNNGGGMRVPEQGDIALLPSNFTSSYAEAGLINVGDYQFNSYQTMKQGDYLQMKKGVNSFIENVTPINNLYSLYIDYLQGEFAVYIGNEKNNMKEITPTPYGIYPLNGAKYFKITLKGNIVAKISYIYLNF